MLAAKMRQLRLRQTRSPFADRLVAAHTTEISRRNRQYAGQRMLATLAEARVADIFLKTFMQRFNILVPDTHGHALIVS